MKLKELLDKIKEWLKKPAKISELHMKKLKNLWLENPNKPKLENWNPELKTLKNKLKIKCLAAVAVMKLKERLKNMLIKLNIKEKKLKKKLLEESIKELIKPKKKLVTIKVFSRKLVIVWEVDMKKPKKKSLVNLINLKVKNWNLELKILKNKLKIKCKIKKIKDFSRKPETKSLKLSRKLKKP